MLPASHQSVLDLVYDRMANTDVEWAVTGSVALALHGLAVNCRDLDLVTTVGGIKQIERVFAREVVVRASLVTRGSLRGHLGRLRAERVEIELLGDVQTAMPGNIWTAPLSIEQHRVWIERNGRRYPVLSLDYLQDVYATMGRVKAAQLIGTRLI
jgi:hypothetical protein